jgi:nucleotide-binding universal stress UspA family protein
MHMEWGMSKLTPYKIVVGVDFSELANIALDGAIDAARRHARSEIHVVTVLDRAGAVKPVKRGDEVGSLDELAASARALVEEKLAAADARTGMSGGVKLSVHVRVGAAVVEILQLSHDVDADLIIVGTHGTRGVSRLWIGSVAERLVRLASCPVMVMRPKNHPANSGVMIDVEPAEPREEPAHDQPHTYAYSSIFDYEADPYDKVW